MKHKPKNENKGRSYSKKTLLKSLIELREIENFAPSEYIDIKIRLLIEYFIEHKIDSAIIAISGGVDSACSLALLCEAQKRYPSILKKILPITMPATNSIGVTGQLETLEKVKALSAALDIEIKTLDMNQSLESSLKAIKDTLSKDMSAWSEGQEVPYLRTSLLYGMTSSLADMGLRPVLIGTTNKDEGVYLGFFGKASDGMVDIQIISDIHKKQVWDVSRLLKVPEEICAATPTGDMYDKRSDEDVFGASYDEVEWAIRQMELLQANSAVDAFENFKKSIKIPKKEQEEIMSAMLNIDLLHKYNSHKYLGCSPAVHLDIVPCKLKKGWRNNTVFNKETEEKLDRKSWVNECNWNPNIKSDFTKRTIEYGPSGIFIFRNAINKKEVTDWLNWANQTHQKWQKVGINGKSGKVNKQKPGSWRKTTFHPSISYELYKRLGKAGMPNYYRNLNIESDLAKSGIAWTRCGISSVWRWIKYEKGDALIPHYDDSFVHSSHKKTLMSVLIYLTDGDTQFITDPRCPQTYNDFTYLWDGSVDYSLKAKAGDVVVFDHRLFHTGPKVDKEKVVIRTDVIFEKPNLGGAIENH